MNEPGKKTITSLEFEHNNWSWGIASKAIFSHLKKDFNIVFIDSLVWKKNRKERKNMFGDVLMSQNPTQFEYVDGMDLSRVVSRLGSNRTFDQSKGSIDVYLGRMSECFAIIATNKKLFNIAKQININTYLIPNGIDLNLWKPNPARRFEILPPTPVIGFCANILTVKKAEYKGYPLVRAACEQLGLPLHEALYKRKQIPHDRMQPDFWDKIHILVHPSMGEGSSNTIMEALALGVPVITTIVAGYHGEMLTHGENVLLCERTVESIASQIRLLISMPSLAQKLSVNGRQFAEQHHDAKKIAEQYKKIFLECSGTEEC